METTVYNQKGESVGKVTLPESIFGAEWNADMVHQVVMSALSSRRNNVAHAKTRGEVRGGGKKPWRQKGTGRARHGSTRSPIWVGGGTTHGPRNDKNYTRKINKVTVLKALASALSKKWKDGELLIMNEINLPEKKTKEAVSVIKAISGIKGFEGLSKKKTNALYISVPKKDEGLVRGFKNIGKVEVVETRNINTADLLGKKYVVFVQPKESFEILTSRLK
jgi:large subunit ribosomal protein L4